MNFRYKLMQFMSGKYGQDTMFYVLFALAAVLALVNVFIRAVFAHLLVQLVVYAILIYAMYRVLSRNIEARRRENRAVSRMLEDVRRWFAVRRQRKADQTHIYKKCPGCSAVLRLPRREGKHTTVCPKCGKEFTVRVHK